MNSRIAAQWGRIFSVDTSPARRRLYFAALLLWLPASATGAAESEFDVGPVTGYTIPRFVSIKRNEANLRVGPGKDYPILFTLTRAGMPVKVIDEFKEFLQVELYDGVKGWLHNSLVTGRRYFLVRKDSVTVRAEPAEDSPPVAIADAGAIVRLRACAVNWCRIEADNVSGWLAQSSGWGVFERETFD